MRQLGDGARCACCGVGADRRRIGGSDGSRAVLTTGRLNALPTQPHPHNWHHRDPTCADAQSFLLGSVDAGYFYERLSDVAALSNDGKAQLRRQLPSIEQSRNDGNEVQVNAHPMCPGERSVKNLYLRTDSLRTCRLFRVASCYAQ